MTPSADDADVMRSLCEDNTELDTEVNAIIHAVRHGSGPTTEDPLDFTPVFQSPRQVSQIENEFTNDY